MSTTLEVFFTPAEIVQLPKQDLNNTTCVVFDVLRATSVFTTVLANGAKSVQPVAEISDALAVKAADPTVLLAGERQGLRILARDSGGVDFDLGNSPREFTRQIVDGRRIVATTTNGTRALRACVGAERVLASSFLNLSATASHLARISPQRVVIVCAGTGELMALEDVLAAGALCAALTRKGFQFEAADSAQAATGLFRDAQSNLDKAIAGSRNGRRLLSIAELRDDVKFCARYDAQSNVVQMNAEGLLISV